MPDDTLDVTSASSTDLQDSEPGNDVISDVTGDQTSGDRPWKNLQSEFNRKLARQEEASRRIEQQVTELVSLVAAGLKKPDPRTAEPEGLSGYSDEDLAKAAALGDAQAQIELTRRITDRRFAEQTAAQRRQGFVVGQLNLLAGKYPQLRDTNSTLYQAAMANKRELLRLGYPDEPATNLEAIKNAIADLAADNPEAVSPARPAAVTRPTATSIGGNAPRKPASSGAKPKVVLSDADRAIAQRMGAKDPEGAMDRLRKRVEEGKILLGPNTAALLREEE